MIKKGILFFILVIVSLVVYGQNDPVLFSVQGNEVRVSEFDYIYSKNNASKADYSRESINEYLDLYVNFKLKVAEARSKKIDTLESYRTELKGYRRQLADSYIVERELAKTIAKEAYNRKKEDVEIAHVLIKTPKLPTPTQIEEARKKANWAIIDLKKGKSFEEVVESYSEDERSKKKGGKTGFVSAILPEGYYALESAIYDTPVGKTSDIVQSPMGLHVLKVLSKRPARGKMTVAHLLIRTKYKGVENPNAKQEIDDIYKRLSAGEDFEYLVSLKSQDQKTKLTGGQLEEFGIGRYESSFEDAAFALKKDGDISKPILTSLGYHIIKRISKKEGKSFDEELNNLIKSTKQKDRQEAGKKKLNEQIKAEAGHICNDDVLNQFVSLLDENFYEFRWQIPSFEDKVLCELGGESFMLSDFAQFSKRQGRMRMQFSEDTPFSEAVGDLYMKYTDQKAIDYQQDRLEEKYIDFRNLMREYEEGILLFEVTKEEVWDKASNDEEGIQKYYDLHKADYFWPERAEVQEYSLRTTNPELIGKVLKKAINNTGSKVAAHFNMKGAQTELVMWKNKMYNRDDEKVDDMNWKKGAVSKPIINNALRMTTFKKIKTILPRGQKSLEDAKGFVISDYQQVLEKEWIESLRAKYPVKIYQKVLKGLFK